MQKIQRRSLSLSSGVVLCKYLTVISYILANYQSSVGIAVQTIKFFS